jgi:hypothetical protein
MQAAMKTHLSQSIGAGDFAGDFEGQHGMSFAISSAIAGIVKSSAIAGIVISSAIADMDISSAIASIADAAPAITGRDSGVNISPAITEIASRRRMVIWRFTPSKSHKTVQIDSLPRLTTP